MLGKIFELPVVGDSPTSRKTAVAPIERHQLRVVEREGHPSGVQDGMLKIVGNGKTVLTVKNTGEAGLPRCARGGRR